MIVILIKGLKKGVIRKVGRGFRKEIFKFMHKWYLTVTYA